MGKIGKVGGLSAAAVLALGLCVALPGTANAGPVSCVDSTGASWGSGIAGNVTSSSTSHRLTITTGAVAPVDIALNMLPTTVRADYSSGGAWTTNGIVYAGTHNPETYAGDNIMVGPLGQSGTGYVSGFAQWVGNSAVPSATNWHFKIDLTAALGGPLWLYCRADTTAVWAV